MSRLFLSLLLLVFANAAHAGAWPRGEGNGFVMVTLQGTVPQFFGGLGPVSTYSGAYLEYGLTDKITLGFDIGHSVSGNSKALFFASYPLGQPDSRHKFAVELGIGRAAGNAVVRPGLSYGRGFDGKLGSGWVSANALFEHHLGRKRTDMKLDFTIGLNHKGGFKSIVQLQAGRQEGDPSFLRIAPSFALPMGKDTHFELGFSTELIGQTAYGLKIGVWRNF